MLRSLFIGIDRYRSPINRLSCCVADATALGSLFKDTHGTDVTMLTDDQATASNIRNELTALQGAAEDDLVIVSFSGHGTTDHRLVPIDADPGDIIGTCISLDDLAQLLDGIPAKNLLVFLDCCFSGGFGGARVFAPAATRDMTEDRSTLETLVRGSGRVVLTASGAGEPALETSAFGHGLLTYHLIDGLQGAEGLASDGLIDIEQLFNAVKTKVIESARLLGDEQTPTTYGSFEGTPALEVLVPGAAYAAAFPDRVTAPVTADWSSLALYGIPQSVLDAWSRAMPDGLNDLQLQAVNDYGVLAGKSVFVVAPTGSGKTMIGELAAVQQAATGGRAVMLLPLRALVNDKYDYFQNLYGGELKVIRASGEYSDQTGDLYNGQYDLALLTYEKFLNIAIASPYVMRGVATVVVDEVQNIADPSRGASLEFLLTLLRAGHARGEAAQVIALSAVIGDTNGLDQWLGAGLLKTTERPIPLRESVIDGYGSAHHHMSDGTERQEHFVDRAYVDGSQGSKPIVIPLVDRLVAEGKKVIVFRSTKGETQGAAGYLAQSLGLPSASSALELLPTGDLSASSQALRTALEGGVGFHNADLDRGERAALEAAFRDPASDLRVLVSTTTLAMGINTPAEAVVIVGLTHPFGGAYSVAEYKNMAGRAGRPGFADAGEAYIVASDSPSPNEAWNHYVLGTPEDIQSHFLGANTDPQTLVIRALAALGGSVDQQELIILLENAFAIWRQNNQGVGTGWDLGALSANIESLVQSELLDQEPDGRITLTALGRFAGESGIEVRSVAQVSSALRFLPETLPLEDLILLAQVTVEADQVYIPTNRKSHQEQQRWPQTLARMGCSTNLVRSLHVGGGDSTQRAKRAVAALRFISLTNMQDVEAELTQHMRENGIAGAVRSAASRTRDVVSTVAQIAHFRGHNLDHESLADGAMVLLETGAPREMTEVAAKLGATLTRAEYLSLAYAGQTTLASLADPTNTTLDEVVGDDERAAAIRALLNEEA